MIYKGYRTMYDFVKFKAVRSLGDAIKNYIITMDMRKNN